MNTEEPRTTYPDFAVEKSGTRQVLSWIAGLLACLALIVAVLHFGSLERIIELSRSARPVWLLLAALAQATTYILAALVWRQSLRRSGNSRPLRDLIPLGVAKLFTDQILPSGGISGTILVIQGLIRRCVPPEVAMATMLVGMISYDIAYLSVVLGSARILWWHGRATLPLFIGVGIFVIITVGVSSAILGLRRFGDRPPISWLTKLLGMTTFFRSLAEAPTDLLRSPDLLLQTSGLQLGIFMLDAVTLWLAFKAIGEVPPVWVVVVSFVIASMAATIGPMPIGLGTFEAGSVGMLTFLGVSVEAALAGTLLLRGLTFWIPMLPGVWLARREIGRR